MQKRKLLAMTFIVIALNCVGVHLKATELNLKIENPVVRLLPPNVVNTAAYFSITNPSDEDVYLISAESDLVGRVELHNHVMDGEVMRMEKQASVLVAAGETVVFQPGGLHVMLFGLEQGLQAGQQVSITLMTQRGQSISFVAQVGEPVKASGHHHH